MDCVELRAYKDGTGRVNKSPFLLRVNAKLAVPIHVGQLRWFRLHSLCKADKALTEIQYVGTLKICRYNNPAYLVDVTMLSLLEDHESTVLCLESNARRKY